MPDVSTRNMHLLFNKLYYQKLTADALKNPDRSDPNRKTPFEASVMEMNETLCRMRFSHDPDFRALLIEGTADTVIPDPSASYHTLHMHTVYPGMMIGIGLPHGSGACNEDIGSGFSFDYVSGQPYIPGSTVKGVLRSAFTAYPQAVAAFLDECAETYAPWSEQDVAALETAIFDNGDSFLDAVLFDSDSEGYVLNVDTLAPHGSDPFKSPNVLSFLKIRPNVYFEFRFVLNKSNAEGKTVTDTQKERLFARLLETFGIGAKTNVGYGILQENADHTPAEKKAAAVSSVPKTNTSPAPRTAPSQKRPSSECRWCSVCNKPNHRYNNKTNTEYPNWKKNVCHICGGKLK